LDLLKLKAGPNSLTFANALAALGRCLLQQEKWIEAEPLLRQCLEIRDNAASGPQLMFDLKSLGVPRTVAKAASDAKPILIRGYEDSKVRRPMAPKPSVIRIPEALDRLIEFATEANRPDEVKKYRALRAAYASAKQTVSTP
ncbi:MAG: tetratricopeptide repeat protein, partial [Gemmataceae bacterium]